MAEEPCSVTRGTGVDGGVGLSLKSPEWNTFVVHPDWTSTVHDRQTTYLPAHRLLPERSWESRDVETEVVGKRPSENYSRVQTRCRPSTTAEVHGETSGAVRANNLNRARGTGPGYIPPRPTNGNPTPSDHCTGPVVQSSPLLLSGKTVSLGRCRGWPSSSEVLSPEGGRLRSPPVSRFRDPVG